jgi:hypothetical protein
MGVHGLQTQDTGVLRSHGGCPTTGLMAQCGFPLQWRHPHRYNMVTRVIKLLALVNESRKHLFLQRNQLSLLLRRERWLKLLLGHSPKQVQQQSIKIGRLSPQEQSVQLRAAKRVEPFARLTRKAHLYQSAMDRFRRSLVYHNRRFGESIQEGKMVDLIDKSEEAELDVALKKKQKNRD